MLILSSSIILCNNINIAQQHHTNSNIFQPYSKSTQTQQAEDILDSKTYEFQAQAEIFTSTLEEKEADLEQLLVVIESLEGSQVLLQEEIDGLADVQVSYDTFFKSGI